MLNRISRYFFWLFLYSMMGWIYESIYCSIREKKLINRGFLNGPYCPIYGFGAIFDIILMKKIDNIFLLFLCGALINCTLEYITSYLMEKIFHTRWWDYSNQKFNINGRVCLLGAVVFGAFSVILLKIIHPPIISLTDKIPQKLFYLLLTIIFIVFLTDIIITLKGFSSFSKKLGDLSNILENKKLRELTLNIEERHENIKVKVQQIKPATFEKLHEKFKFDINEDELNKIFSKYSNKLNTQQKRMIKAFPHLKSTSYNETLTELRKYVQRLKEEKRKE